MNNIHEKPGCPTTHDLFEFWKNTPVRTAKRGHFWIAGERIARGGQTYQNGPMFVAWEAPEQVSQPYPIILIHGGLLQGTEWLDTPDARPGWAQRLVEQGYAVLVVDRPGHGHSHTHPDITGPVGAPFAYEDGRRVFFPPEWADRHTQWPFDRENDAAFDAFIAPFGPLPANLAESQEMDTDRLVQLLDRIGPSILMTHSASGPVGWLVADRRPALVVGIVTVEPIGPAFAEIHGIGRLDWGLTAAPVTYNPPRKTAADAEAADPAKLQMPALKGLPVVLVTGGASPFARSAPAVVEFLNVAGASAEELHLPDHGIHGNGHGLIYELNSDQALAPVLRWLKALTGKKESPDQIQRDTETVLTDPDHRKAILYVTYPGAAAVRFDRDYYVDHHVPLVKKQFTRYGLLTAAAYFPAEADAGLIAVCVCEFDNEQAIEDAFSSAGAEAVMADVKNFTDLVPVRHIVLAG
jgi:uncharacterized protein (TIGR02118 family)